MKLVEHLLRVACRLSSSQLVFLTVGVFHLDQEVSVERLDLGYLLLARARHLQLAHVLIESLLFADASVLGQPLRVLALNEGFLVFFPVVNVVDELLIRVLYES